MEKIDETINDFMNVTAKTKIAIIIPLYGFWSDVKNNPVNGEVLNIALSKLYSQIHQTYLIFVANPQTLPNDASDSSSVGNVLLKKTREGNMVILPVERDATYTDYIQVGMDYAISETNASFMVVFNPWVMIQDQALDILVDRCNRADDAKVVSGFDLRSVIEPESFNLFKPLIPSEERDLSFNLVAMPRYMAEQIMIDDQYHTHTFLQRDMWQQVRQKSFEAITSQRIPIFPFDFPWEDYETKEQFEEDKQRFIGKWRFDPGIYYEDPSGVSRKDKTGAR